VDAVRPQRKRTTYKLLGKRSGEGNVDSGLQVQLEEDGDGSTRQSWMQTSAYTSIVVLFSLFIFVHLSDSGAYVVALSLCLSVNLSSLLASRGQLEFLSVRVTNFIHM